MDKITGGLLAEFSKEFEIEALSEDKRFEQFAAYLTVRRHYSDSAFSPSDLVMGSGGDTGIDAIAVIINNNLITDLDAIDELVEINGYLDVTFVFIQAERSASFSTAKIGQFGFGVRDLLGDRKLARSEDIKAVTEIVERIFALSSRFKGKNPACFLYYVTTGKGQDQNDIRVRRDTEWAEMEATGLFREVQFFLVGADQLQSLYNQTKNSVQREFQFSNRIVVPDIAGVKEAYLGYMTATEILKLVRDDRNSIMKSLFYDNVRDWEGYNAINHENQTNALQRQ